MESLQRAALVLAGVVVLATLSGCSLFGDKASDLCVGEAIRWRETGGKRRYEEERSIVPCRVYQRTRWQVSGQKKVAECRAEDPKLGADLAKVVAQFGSPVVQEALGRNALLGEDTQSADEPVFRIDSGAHHLIVGRPCVDNSPASCEPIPVEVTRFAARALILDNVVAKTQRCAMLPSTS